MHVLLALLLAVSPVHAGKAKVYEAALAESTELRSMVSRRLRVDGCDAKSPETTGSLLAQVQEQSAALGAMLGDANKTWLPRLTRERTQLLQTEQRILKVAEAYPSCVCSLSAARTERSTAVREAASLVAATGAKEKACRASKHTERRVSSRALAAHSAFDTYARYEEAGHIDEKGEGKTAEARRVAAAYAEASNAMTDAQIAHRKAEVACKEASAERSRVSAELFEAAEAACLEEVRAGVRPTP